MKRWFTITAKSDTEAEICIYDEIGLWGITAGDFLDEFKAVGARKIKLRINSPGGAITDGLAIYNRLREHKPGVEVIIDGIAASMASVIAMVGSPVRIADNAFVMIHNPNGLCAGDAEDMREVADLLDKMKSSLITAYVRKTGLAPAKVEDLMDKESWFSAQEAKALGFADEVTEGVEAAARFDTSKFRNPPQNLFTMKILTASIAALLATATGAKITEETPEADVKLAIEKLTGDFTAEKKKVTDLTKERDDLKAQFDELTVTATKATADLTAANKKVTDTEKERDDFSAKLTKSEESVKRMKALCGVKGINPNEAPESVLENNAERLTYAQWEAKLKGKTGDEYKAVMVEFEKAVNSGHIAAA